MKQLITFILGVFFVGTFHAQQIGIQEDFDSSGSGINSGWTNNGFSMSGTFSACEGQSYRALMNGGNTASLVSPLLTGASNGQQITVDFDFKAYYYSFFGGNQPAPANWGDMVVEYSTDGTTWTNVGTINDSNYTSVDACDQINYTIAAGVIPVGSNFQIRWVATNVTGAYYVFLDNISVTQPVTSVPNCDATVLVPADAAVDLDVNDLDLVWTNATGVFSGYKINIGTTSGGTELLDGFDVGDVSEYTLTGTLDYDTTYYVTIVPYNSSGDATGCTNESTFTTRPAPITGATCADPLLISPVLPYSATGTTSGFEDFYESTPCGNPTYFGEEVVYSITPTEDISVNVEVTNIAGGRVVTTVLDDCPDLATACIGYGDSTNDLNDIIINEIVLLSGSTYYIVVGAQNGTGVATYDLDITQNTCVVSTFTLTADPDCGNDQFSVDVDVLSLGSATTVSITDDQGSVAQSASVAGIVTMGPYASGADVTFTMSDTADTSCSITESFTYYCPPANDTCTTAEVLVLSDDTCNNIVSGDTYGASANSEITGITECGDTSANKMTWYEFTPATDGYYEFSISNISGDSSNAYVTVYEGTCGSVMTMLSSCYVQAVTEDLTAGTTYYAVVRTSSGLGANFDICVKSIDVPENTACDEAVSVQLSDMAGATNVISANFENTFSNILVGCLPWYVTSSTLYYTFTPTQTGTYYMSYTGVSGTFFNISTGSCSGLTVVESAISDTTCMNADGTFYLDATAGTTYYITVYGSGSAPFSFYVYPDESLSTPDFDNGDFGVNYSPNPVKDKLNISASVNIKTVEVYSAIGQQVYKASIGSMDAEVNFESLNSGMYFIKLDSEKGSRIIKVIKK